MWFVSVNVSFASETFAVARVLAVGPATVIVGACTYLAPSSDTAISVTLSTPATDSPWSIPNTLLSIVPPCPSIGGLDTVAATPLSVLPPKLDVNVKPVFVSPTNVCELLPVPVMLITEPPSVADTSIVFAS